MQTVNVHEATTNFGRLLETVEHGEDVVIARGGEPIATLTAYKSPRRKIAPPGSMEGQIWMADDFNDSLDSQFDALQIDARGDYPESRSL